MQGMANRMTIVLLYNIFMFSSIFIEIVDTPTFKSTTFTANDLICLVNQDGWSKVCPMTPCIYLLKTMHRLVLNCMKSDAFSLRGTYTKCEIRRLRMSVKIFQSGEDVQYKWHKSFIANNAVARN